MSPKMPSRPLNYDLLRAEGDYPAWEGPPHRTFLLAITYRSGSHLLAEALRLLGGYGSPLDYFDSGVRLHLENRWGVAGLPDYLAALSRFRTDPTGSLGVKFGWGNIIAVCLERDPSLEPLLKQNLELLPLEEANHVYEIVWATLHALFPHPRFVHLTRRDKLRQAVSWVRAGQTGDYWGLARANESPAREVAYDFDKITAAVASFTNAERRMRALFAWADVEPVNVVYEPFIADYAGTVQRVAAALDGRREMTVSPPRLQRQGDEISEQWVRRYLEEQSMPRNEKEQNIIVGEGSRKKKAIDPV